MSVQPLSLVFYLDYQSIVKMTKSVKLCSHRHALPHRCPLGCSMLLSWLFSWKDSADLWHVATMAPLSSMISIPPRTVRCAATACASAQGAIRGREHPSGSSC